MARQNQSYVEGLAQITTEEGQLAYGIQRYILGVIAVALWVVFIAYTFTDVQMPFKWQGKTSFGAIMVFALLAIGFTIGSWWANRIHRKLTDLRERTRDE
ncbi:hypothetical protein [Kordiimonas aquimaris]|jgi:cytochrome oxidase assembly protein ShyY1|uniref:hypothetical protein n=1 Tax=Kordiimonas aquimaris TaxID=707591 RepID=UPI0021D39B3F|nr:hypothetical protein [Kordiimonas aquimaris]